MGIAKTDQLGTNERIHEKIEKIKQFAREAPVVASDDGAKVQGLRDALRVLQTRERELHQQLEEANMRVERERELYQQLEEADMRVERERERIEVIL